MSNKFLINLIILEAIPLLFSYFIEDIILSGYENLGKVSIVELFKYKNLVCVHQE